MSTPSTALKLTPLSDWHLKHGGRMVDFAQWSMPVQYQSVIQEHHQTRKAVGLFDVSHMGRFFFYGTNVGQWIDGLMTRRIAGVDSGKIRYSLVTNENGMILDDVLVYHLDCNPEDDGSFAPSQDNGDSFYMVVVNAGNREKLASWFQSHIPEGSDIRLEDRTEGTAMIAVQGPQANGIIAKMGVLDPETLAYYTGAVVKVDDQWTIVSRTGYTDEDGCELIVDASVAESLWEKLADQAEAVGGGASGLAARDTLRLEAGMPLYGHELSEEINAASTGLGFAINRKGRTFCGDAAIARSKEANQDPVRVGLELEGRRPAREGCPVLAGGTQIGTLTSGTLSPTLEKPIAMGYLAPDFSAVGTKVDVDIRGKTHAATVVKLPFYQRG